MGSQSLSIYVGPSVYAQDPVIHFALDKRIQQIPEAVRTNYLSKVFSWFPNLKAQLATAGVPSCCHSLSTHERVANHIFEHICIDLQDQAGAKLKCVREDCLVEVASAAALVPYEDSQVCEEAARLCHDLLLTVQNHVNPQAVELTQQEQAMVDAFEFSERLSQFLNFATRHMFPVQDRELMRLATAHDIPANQLAGRVITLGHGRYQQRLSATKTSCTNVVSNDLAANKDYTRRILHELGLPAPDFKRVWQRRDVVAAAEQIGYPVVVKPTFGNMGAGVSVGMNNTHEVLAAYKRARQHGRSVLVEEMVPGADYRLLVINGRFCAASHRIPGHVVGDGKQTVDQLVTQLNSDPRRGDGPTTSWTRIRLDDQADRLLDQRGYSRESVPVAGEEVYLRRNANTSDGGTAVDVTDLVHPDNRDIAVRAAKAVGLDIAGVDFLTTDITTSMWTNGGKICEINSRPGIRKHIWPAEGKPRDVLSPILSMLFPAGQPKRVPIIAIARTEQSNLTSSENSIAQALAQTLTEDGHHVGLLASGRVTSGGRMTDNRTLTIPEATRRILLDPDVEIAVLELDLQDVAKQGLGRGEFDTVIFDNSSQQDVLDESELITMRVIARNCRGEVLLREDDPCSAELYALLPSRQIRAIAAASDAELAIASRLSVASKFSAG